VSLNERCQICNSEQATHDAKLTYGPWAYVCYRCFKKIGCQTEGLSTVINKEELSKQKGGGNNG